MVEYRVLITTSGIGSRLGELTDFTNKSLVRITDKPSISHIIEHYPDNTSFVITLGHFGQQVRDFLELAYPDKKFTFVTVDDFEGPSSSLGYSILQSKEELQCPFIFHASDTVLTKKDTIPNLDFNWCAGAYKSETSQYRTLRVADGVVDTINEKGATNFDYPYIGLCGIKDYKLFWDTLGDLKNIHTLSDVHVINEMLKTVEFKFHKINKWLDVGNVSELNNTRKEFSSTTEILDKKKESIYFFKDFVIKFFSDATISKNRVERAHVLRGLVPEIIDSRNNFYKYNRVPGKLFSESVNVNTFSSFLDWTKINLWKRRDVENFNTLCFDFYINKTRNRINSYLDGKRDVAKVINGELIPPVKTLLSEIDDKWLCDGIPSQIHGDFILDNILETKNGFCLLDWRQDFAGNLVVGDLYYDLAKLNHNLMINHAIVNAGHFNLSNNNCDILYRSTLIECREVLYDFIKQNSFDLRKVKLLSAIIWINMAPLHEYPFNKFLFNFGKYNLYKTIRSK